MATYRQIQDWVRASHGFMPKPCWIAHCKELEGLPVKVSHRRHSAGFRQVPCPPEKRNAIRAAFEHFGMR
jgi:hypothetical protein